MTGPIRLIETDKRSGKLTHAAKPAKNVEIRMEQEWFTKKDLERDQKAMVVDVLIKKKSIGYSLNRHN